MSVQPRGVVAHPVGSVMPGLVKLRVSVIWNCFVPHCHSPHTATGGGASVTPCLSVCGGVILSGERGGLRGGRQARPGPLGSPGGAVGCSSAGYGGQAPFRPGSHLNLAPREPHATGLPGFPVGPGPLSAPPFSPACARDGAVRVEEELRDRVRVVLELLQRDSGEGCGEGPGRGDRVGTRAARALTTGEGWAGGKGLRGARGEGRRRLPVHV